MHLRSALYAAAALPALVRSSPTPPQSRNPRSLAKRAVTGVACGGFSSASPGDADQNVSNLKNKDGQTVTVAAGTCNRVGCYNTSGVYVCNDQDADITIDIPSVGSTAELIDNTCIGGDGFSGQIFYDDLGGYNVIAAFCDNNDDVATPPSAYTPPGPNGSGTQYCGGNDQQPCALGTCDKSTITLDNEGESVTCDAWMAGTICGAGATIQYSESRTVTKGWTFGGFVGLDSSDLATVSANLGFFASYTSTVATGTIEGVSKDCGAQNGANGLLGNWTCGMEINPKCWSLTGTCHSYYTDDSTGDVTDLGIVPWGLLSPQYDDANQAVVAPNMCTCNNCAGWADGGAPQPLCDMDCLSCDTPDGGS